MKNTLSILVFAAALVLTQAVQLNAQTQEQQQPSNTDPNTTPATRPSPTDQSFAVTLGTGQAVSLSQGGPDIPEPQRRTGTAANTHSQFIYGATASSVYMDSYTANSITNIVSGEISPYAGVYIPRRTGGMMFQYSGTFLPSDAFNGDFQAFHSGAFNAVGAFNRRWYWGLNSGGGYGSEIARFEGPLSYSLVGLVPAVDPIAAGTFFNGRNAAFLQNSAKLGWLRSEKDRFELSVFHNFTDLTADPAHGILAADRANSIGTQLDYMREVSPRVKLGAYAMEDRLINSGCNTYGGGAGVQVDLTHRWALEARAGPQRTSANCGRQMNASFFGSLTKALKGRARMYVVGQRYFSTAYQTVSTWQDSVAAGILEEKGRFSIQGDVGYFKGAPILITAEPIQGYYAAPLLRLKITDSTAISGGYRLFHATGGNVVPGNLHFASVSLEWRPAPIALR